MSTAISALRSYDPAEVPEPVLRRRRTARAPRPFALVRGQGRNSAARREVAARFIPHPPQLSAPATPVRRSREAEVVRGAELRARGVRTFDITEAEVDLAFATVPRWESTRSRSVTRALVGDPSPIEAPTRRVRAGVRASDRGPELRGPRSEQALYARVVGSGARGAHPMVRVRQAQAGLAALALTALVTALIVVTFLGLAHLRAGSFGEWAESTPGISQPGDHPQVGLFETRPQK
ncbi:hypothetical protein [Nocardia ignorata]|uniref:Uncharacterized protein n=1 Tax=Nocardia ignorata TaxID=145285 RepID=A0A4R6PS54_NOCIG|nr:hypothetical protein [Nocardia ignorata]TDP41548.1 hypothetical protein DFR75_101651 [Nocardia ignorata]